MFTSRSTLVAGLAVLALTTACAREAGEGITGPPSGAARSPAAPGSAAAAPAPRSFAPRPPAAAPAPGTAAAPHGRPTGPGHDPSRSRAGGEIIGWDQALSPVSYRDANGRLFEVVFGVDASGAVAVVQHSRDGIAFATTGGDASAGEVLVSLFTNGQMGYEQIVSLGAPLGARHTEQRAGPRPRQRPPERAMALIPCEDEWSAYAAAATGMLLAYAIYRARPSIGTAATLSAAVGAFVRSWLSLYSCMEDYYALRF